MKKQPSKINTVATNLSEITDEEEIEEYLKQTDPIYKSMKLVRK